VAATLWYPLLGLTALLVLPVLGLGLGGTRASGLAGWVKLQSRAISWVSHTIGITVAWATLLMVLTQFAVVVLRYVFGFNSIALQESVIYAHGIMFMLASAYTLMMGGHVRVDIFYHNMSERMKARVDLAGTIFLLIPVMLLILNFSWPYVENAWRIHEGSRESSGLPYVYLLKSVIVGFAGLMLAQGIAIAGRAALVISGHESTMTPQEVP